MENQHREVKILLWAIFVVLIAVIIGSIYTNRQGESVAQREALENALEESKREMERKYDPILVNSIELENVEVVRERRDEIIFEVTVSIPLIEEVMDRLYEELVEEEVWKNPSLERALEKIHRNSVDIVEREKILLTENITIRRDDKGKWRGENPEAFEFVLPRSNLRTIAMNLEQFHESMDFHIDVETFPEESLEGEVLRYLKHNGFFNDYKINLEKNSDENEYHLTAKINNLSVLNELEDVWQYREFSHEIDDRESLIAVILRKLEDIPKRNVLLHSLKLQEYERSYNEDFGFEMNFTFVYEGNPHTHQLTAITHFSLDALKRLYSTIRPGQDDRWPEPLWKTGPDEGLILAAHVRGDTLAHLFWENKQLVFRARDRFTGAIMKEVIVEEHFEVDESQMNYLESYFSIKEQDTYYVLSYDTGRYDGRSMATVVGKEEGDLMLSDGFPTDEQLYVNDDVFFHNRRSYHSRIYRIPGDTFDFTAELVDRNNGDMIKQIQSNLRLNYFHSEAHEMVIFYPMSMGPLNTEMNLKDAFTIYDFNSGAVIHENPITEAFQGNMMIETLHPVDEDRILVKTHLMDWWMLDLKDLSLENLGTLGKSDPEDPINLRDSEEYEISYNYRFTSLEEGYSLMEIYSVSGGGLFPIEYHIWKDEGISLTPVMRVKLDYSDERVAFFYNKADDVFMVAEEFFDDGKTTMNFSIFDISYSALNGAKDLVEITSFNELKDRGYISELVKYEDVNGVTEDRAFHLWGETLYHRIGLETSEFMKFDREDETLFLINWEFARILTENGENKTLPTIWGYDQLRIHYESGTIYYEDERGAFLYDLAEFLESLNNFNGR